jgi:hypothetical protein
VADATALLNLALELRDAVLAFKAIEALVDGVEIRQHLVAKRADEGRNARVDNPLASAEPPRSDWAPATR